MAAELTFGAMGSDAHVIVVGPSDLADMARARIAELEGKWSRFVPTSEVSRLNEAGGSQVEVSQDTAILIERALQAWRLSAGFVDCTMLQALLDAGYDRTFEDIPSDRGETHAIARVRALLGPTDIEVDGSMVRMPQGMGFDPGGVGKGLAADLVSAEVMDAGADGVCVNLGGDLRVRGTSPDGGSWTVAIEHPHRDASLALVGIQDGAVATSTTLRRAWQVGGQPRHHLIDPRTGEPSTSPVALVTAVGRHAWVTETLAKAILLRGGDHPFDLVDGTGVDALTVGQDGSVSASAGLTRFLGAQALPSSIANPVQGTGV